MVLLLGWTVGNLQKCLRRANDDEKMRLRAALRQKHAATSISRMEWNLSDNRVGLGLLLVVVRDVAVESGVKGGLRPLCAFALGVYRRRSESLEQAVVA